MEKKTIKLSDKQDKFIFSSLRDCAFGGGWGNGKTLAGCIKTFFHLQNNKDALAFVGRKDATDLRDSTMQDFREWFGDKLIENRGERSFTYKPTNSKAIFRHADDLGKLTNINLSFFWLDQAEELTLSEYTFLKGRLRRSIDGIRQGCITFNMEGHNWIWDKWKKQSLPNHMLVEGATHENKEHLPADYLEDLEVLKQTSPNVYKRYVLGNWDVFEGQIYGEYSDKIHVIDPFTIPKEWTKVFALDHGLTNPTAGLWGAVDYDDNLYIYDGHYQAGELVSYHAEKIKAKTGEDEISAYLIDPSCAQQNAINRRSVMGEYLRQGIYFMPAKNDVRAGINRVKEYLRVDPNRIHPIDNVKGSPRLFIFDVEGTIKLREELPQYKWKSLRGKVGEENQPEKPNKYFDHAADALRYMIMYLWKPVKQVKKTSHKNDPTIDDSLSESLGGNKQEHWLEI